MSTVPRLRADRDTQLLNGWWDFQPVAHSDFSTPIVPTEVPADGWLPAAYLAPGFFTDHPYPEAWRESRSGWMRTAFTVAPQRDDQRAYLTIEAAIPKAFIFVNGRQAAAQEDMFLGEPIDVTDFLHTGENELAVLLTEFPSVPHPTEGWKFPLIDVPWGCCIARTQAGIWQDVTLEWRSAVHVSEVTIRTSVREQALTVITRVTNAGTATFDGALAHTVEDDGDDLFTLSPIAMTLEPGETREITETVPWADAREWSPEDPYLYHLRSEIILGDAPLTGEAGEQVVFTRLNALESSANQSADRSHGTGINDAATTTSSQAAAFTDQVVDRLRTRFGFREVWIDGYRVLLNGRPQRWRGEWCHKEHSHWLRPEYVRQWYRQIKALNMNYVRMHTYPHPGYYLDIADEMGILVCQETALHGSGPYGTDSPALWERAREHVHRMVRRDKNHPSLVLWSAENEMRWALNLMPSAKEELPRLRELFNELDPTRPAYHDGDSSLWNEETQQMISRHYGPSCHGWGWWDQQKPLHSGEMGRWHYSSPYTALVWAGDEVFTDYALISQSIARDAARIIELGRANEVTCLFPWNTSGLDNFRPAEAKTFTWEPNTRYLKPLAHRPYESEYAWWEDGAGCRQGYSFTTLRHAFRPLAIVIREERAQCFSDRKLPHTIYLVNDLPIDVTGEVTVSLTQAEQVCWEDRYAVRVKSGCTTSVYCDVPMDSARHGEEAVIATTFASPQGYDEVRRQVHILNASSRATPLALPPIGIWGKSAISVWLPEHGITPILIKDDQPLDPNVTPLVIVGEHQVEPGSTQNHRLRDFLLAGGRALVLEQSHSIFPELAIARMPVETAHVRDAAHPVLNGLSGTDFRFFGDDPFGLPSSDAWVTCYPYVKPTGHQVVRPLVDSSGGDFGVGGLTWSPLVEARIGPGVVIATQLRLTDRLAELPVADRLLQNALRYLADYQPAADMPVFVDGAMQTRVPEALPALTISDAMTAPLAVFAGDAVPVSDAAAIAGYVAGGNTVIVWGLGDEARGYWEQVIGRSIEVWTPEHEVYQLIANRPSSMLAGISNEDTCWLDNWSYRKYRAKEPIVDRLLTIEDATVHLQNADRSGLDRLFGDNNATEWKMMPTLSAFYDNPPPSVGGGLVETPVGAGRVIFCQLRWRPELWQFRRFLGLFLWNLGVPVATDILAGACTPTAGHNSEGYPVKLRIATGLDKAGFQELLMLSKRRVEYCSENETFLVWPGWQQVESPEGAFTTSGDEQQIIGIKVVCSEPRKIMETVGGLPNPDLQTFLRLHGTGEVAAWINGVDWGHCTLAPDKDAYIADIDFEVGANFVILAWQPGAPSATISCCFDNKDHRPETTFTFE